MQNPQELVKDSVVYLDYLIQQLGNSYDEMYYQNGELEDLANALDALAFAKTKLDDHAERLESNRKKLLKGITTSYEEINNAKT